MKNLVIALFMILGFSCFAHADEQSLVTLPVTIESMVEMSAPDQPTDTDVQGGGGSTSRYCCMNRGNYCDMGYTDRFGQPCKCYTGNNVYHGHVCRN